MIAYYVHWIYPPTADDELFYGGIDDEKLFHHQENAEKNGNKYVVVREFIDFKTLIENYLEDEKS